MTLVRAPAVAGSFYSDNTSELSSTLDNLIKQAQLGLKLPENISKNISNARAFIIPHAGYQYSGQTAAFAYAIIKANKKRYKSVLIIGPCHRVWVESIALPYADFFSTPLGAVKIDKQSIKSIYQMGFAEYSDTAHLDEHSIELHLPFIQACLNEVDIIPVAVGEAQYQNVAKMIEMLWDKPDCLIIISSDLSHFNTYDKANIIDSKTTTLIEQLSYTQLDSTMACGCTGIQALLKVAESKALSAHLIKQCNSGDIYGDKSRVVGYGSYAFF